MPNNKSKIWNARSMVESMTRGTHATAMRSLSKPSTGQFAEAFSQGQFGVYVLNGIGKSELNVNNLIPPYVTESHTVLNDKVGLSNIHNALIETTGVMIADDRGCRFSYDPDTATYTLKYVKTTGTAQFGGIVIGRTHSDSTAHFAYLLGDHTPPDVATPTTDYLLEHRSDRTILWKTVNASRQYAWDLLTKQVTLHASASLHNNIAADYLTGGMIFGLLAVKAVRHAISTTSVTVRLNTVNNLQTSTTTEIRDIVFEADEDATIGVAANVSPVMVARPDINGFEVFVPMELSNGKCVLKKATVTNLEDGIANADIAITTVAELPYLISKVEDGATTRHVSGYYDVAKKRYYLPYSAYVDENGTAHTIQTTAYQPGLVYNDSFTTLIDRYYARLNDNCHLPVKTDAGVLYQRCGTTTMHYFQGHCIIAGTIFDEIYEKPIDDIFELTYRFKFE
jgi:hypothetical protein